MIVCARTAQHVKPTQPSSSDVFNKVSSIISQKLSEFARNINSMQLNYPWHSSPSPRRVHFQSPKGRRFQRGPGQTEQAQTCGKCGKLNSKFQCPAFNKTCNFCKKRGHFVCMSLKAKVQSGSGRAIQ